MKLSKSKTKENPNYLGWDEDYNGDWGDFFMCSSCRENNYIRTYDKVCGLCGEDIEWVD